MDNTYNGVIGTTLTAIMWLFWGILRWIGSYQAEISMWLPIVVSFLAGIFWVMAISEKIYRWYRTRKGKE